MDSQRPNRKNSIRLHKYLAECGVGSRRSCERDIASGLVAVDGQVVRNQGIQIDPHVQLVTVRGEPVKRERRIYLVLNKPRDVLCTSSDPRGRRTYQDFLPPLSVRVYTVGRLDRDSEGLLLITNDGDLAARLTHPKHQTPKKYSVWVNRVLTSEERVRLKAGVHSNGELLRAAEIQSGVGRGRDIVYEVVLLEGKNRHIRRMFSVLGVEVSRLVRTHIGPLKLGKLARGECRELTRIERTALERLGR